MHWKNQPGLQLIEASAGTGKTYTITSIYSQLLLENNLDPSRILVVTFTKAATAALRERIRHRVISDWRLAQHEATKYTLEQAASRMDEAAIYTIHSFCERILQDYAFESGAIFASELVANETDLRRTAIEDVWRKRLYGASLEEADWICNHWADPYILLKDLEPTLAIDNLRFLPAIDPQMLQQERLGLLAISAQISSQWPQVRDEILQLLVDNPNLDKRKYKSNKLQELAEQMDQFVAAKNSSLVLPQSFDFFQYTSLKEHTKKKCKTPQHPFFDLCDQLGIKQLNSNNQCRYALWFQEARTEFQETLTRAKASKGLLSFDDLLKHLDLALADPEMGDPLAQAIRERFPVALIDEFQDTDQKQYNIFRRIYADHPECRWFLIGDPKQAIYSFRGADIFTYIQAKTDVTTGGSEHTLGTNWRSSSKLITAINTIFSNIPNPFLYDAIPFNPVKAGSTADNHPLLLDGVALTPLQFWLIAPTENNIVNNLPTKIKVESAEEEAARACAEYIATLLQLSASGRAKLGQQPLHPQDIAILVRKHKEGAKMQLALHACNVRSVTLSENSVFTTEQAAELAILLEAVSKPSDEGQVRAALATILLGWNANQLETLFQNEARWDEVLTKLQDYRTLWVDRGFIVAFQRMLEQEAIPQRLLQRKDGERWLTNLLQLAELLQIASLQHVGIDGLLHWFYNQIIADNHASGKVDDASQLRLESDAGLVQIVTMHVSKGLEYPLVFIPFPWSLKPRVAKDAKLIAFHDEVDFTPCLNFQLDTQSDSSKLHQKEAIAEDTRLLYVALTRAAQLCVLCWGPINGAAKSAPAMLLHPEINALKSDNISRMDKLSWEELRADLEIIAAKAPDCISVRELPAQNNIYLTDTQPDATALKAAVFKGVIDNSWGITSYSALVKREESVSPDYDELATTITLPMKDVTKSEENATSIDPIFTFPAGATTGLYLHALLQRLDFPKADAPTLQTAAQALLPRYGDLQTSGVDKKATDWSSVTVELISNCLDTPLNFATADTKVIRLRDITRANRIQELEFYYPVTKITPSSLKTALAAFPGYNDIATRLEFKACHGLMHGFIDLVFRCDGRYYLVDYKSNWLGNNLENYSQTNMHQAIRLHHYDLQQLIYAVALQRFLKQRLPDYNYEQHFGGVYYLFLRGMRQELGPSHGVYFTRPTQQLIASLDVNMNLDVQNYK